MSLKKITITNTMRGVVIPRAKITRAIIAACSELKKGVTMNVIFVSDKKISNLHSIFMHDNSPTDVLSFVLEESTGSMEAEIYISAERARVQAAENNVSWQNELVRLATHGTLHAVGYDDLKPRLKTAMWKRQEAIVQEVFARKTRTAANPKL